MYTIITHLLFTLLLTISTAQIIHAQNNDHKTDNPYLNNEELTWLNSQPKITVGVMKDWPPLNFVDKNGKPSGLGASIIRQMNRRLDGRLLIVPGEWKEIYDAVKNNQLDAIMDITPKKAREPYFNFTTAYLDVPHIFIAKKSTPFIQSESSFGSRTLALEKGFGNVKYFQQNYPAIKLRLYTDTTEALEAVSRGEVDAYAGNRVVALYLIEKLSLSNLSIHGRLTKPGSILAIGTRKNAVILRNIMQKTLNQIGANELRKISSQWIHAVALDDKRKPQFTESENEWIEQHRVIPIGVDGNWPPIDFFDENNQFRGITADYLDLIGKKIGVTFEPQKSASFKLMLQKVMEGELKAGATISYKQERAEKLLFTRPFFHVQKIIMAREENSDYRNIENLYGKTVAVEDGFLTMRQLQEKHPQIKLLPVTSTIEALKKVSWGEADAYIGNQAVATWLQRKNQLTNLKITGDPGLGKAPQNFAVSRNAPDWAPLTGIIDKVLAGMTIEQQQEIENRWLSVPTSNPSAIPRLELSPKEKEFLKKHPEIVLGVDTAWKPLEYIDDNGYQGLSSDYMEYFSRQLGISFKQPDSMPWMMVIQGLRDKTIDLAPLVVKTEKRSSYLNFTDPYLDFPIVIFNRRGETLLGGVADLAGKKVGLVRGYAIGEILSKDYPEIQQEPYINTLSGLKALSTGEIDAYIDVLAVGGYLIAAEGMSNLQVASSTPFTYQLSMGVRKDWPELTGILNKAIHKLPAEKKNEFLKNWLVVNYAQKIDYRLLIWVVSAAFIIFALLGIRARELAKVNAKLSEGRKRLSLTLESAELGTWEITYSKQRVATINWDETFAKHHAIPASTTHLNAKDFSQFISTDHYNDIRQFLIQYIKGQKQEFKVEYLTLNEHHWIASQGRILKRDQWGRARRIVGISQDITEQKIAHLQMEKSSQFKSQFLANMSHEIRTPMNAIVGLGHLLSKTNLDEKQSDYIRNLQKSAQSLLGLIDDILDVSKIEAGHLNIEKIEFNLEELLNDLAELSALKIESNKVEFIYNMDAHIPTQLIGDPFRINQVLSNLVSNAIKFTEAGNILLSVSVIEQLDDTIRLKFEVSDNGIGIAADKLGSLFSPFVQEDGSTTRKYGGTGLGLSISKQLTELMGGKMDAQSTPGKGSRFYFNLPFTIVDTEQLLILDQPDPNLRGLKVLLVDDNPLSLKILNQTLQSMSFNVTGCASGKQAIELLTEDQFELVLLDWKMPGMDGEKTAKYIRESLNRDKLPIIIMMTAYGREAVEHKIDHMSLDGFLVKPITPSQLFNAIILAKNQKKHSIKIKPGTKNEPLYIQPLQGDILLAEDNKINQQVAQEILQQMGLQVTICETGKEVLEQLKTTRPDLILMDIQMPDMDGYEATREIRKIDSLKQLPVIAMTANAMIEDVENSLQAGMNAHISKPVDHQLLYQTLKKFLKLQPPVENKPLTVSEPSSSQSWPDSIPGLNIKQGIKQIGGNEPLYQKLLRDFAQNHGHLVDTLQQALTNNNQQEVKRLLHTIKGVAGSIGADEMVQITTQIEKDYKQQLNIPDKLLQTLIQASDLLFNSLKTLIAESSDSTPADQIKTTELHQSDLLQLNSALQAGDSNCMDTINHLSDGLVSLLGQDAFNELTSYVEDYEFDLAAGLLSPLVGEQNSD